MTREEVKEIGFKEMPHFTIMNSLIYELGRGRELSFGCIGEPNEMLTIAQREGKEKVSDLVVLSNYDYDGLVTKEWLTTLLSLFHHHATPSPIKHN